MEARVIPSGTMLMHVRNFTEDDEKLNKLGYPTWYFLKPTFFIFVQTKSPAINDGKYFLPDSKISSMTSIVAWRLIDAGDKLMEKYQIKSKDSAFTDLVDPASNYMVDTLKVDVFKVVQDMPILFLSSPKTDPKYFNDAVQKIDPSFQPTDPESNFEAADWLFKRNDSSGIILHPLQYQAGQVDEVILMQKSVPYLRFLASIDVQQYEVYARQFR